MLTIANLNQLKRHSRKLRRIALERQSSVAVKQSQVSSTTDHRLGPAMRLTCYQRLRVQVCNRLKRKSSRKFGLFLSALTTTLALRFERMRLWRFLPENRVPKTFQDKCTTLSAEPLSEHFPISQINWSKLSPPESGQTLTFRNL